MTILRNVLAVIAGIVLGGVVNMSLIVLGSSVVPLPLGVDAKDVQSLSANMHLLEPRHFVFPFLAHALGTLSGALTAFLIARSHGFVLACVVGAVNLAGGIAAAFMIPAPAWFVVLDLLVAYIPTAWIGAMIGRRLKGFAVERSDR